MAGPEAKIEAYLTREIKKIGGKAYKFSSPGKRSVPDRLCVLPKGEVVFVEVKALGKEPTSAQYRELDALRSLGHWATWVSTKRQVRDLIQKIQKYLEAKE